MTPNADLQQAWAEWRRLAEAEGRAIRAGNWAFVAECQKARVKLRQKIDDLGKESGAKTRPDPLPSTKSIPRSIVLELIELQRRNLASLEQRRQRLSDHIEHLTRSSRNLRGIQRSYAPPGPAAWSSYS